VLGLTLFSFATGVELTVPPGASGTVHYQLDLNDLKHQATGLIDTELIVRNHARDQVAVVHMVADVRGSLWSVYGLLGLALLVLTALATVDAAIAIARHKDSQNRWRRGLRLLTPGIGIGLVLAFSASVVRWWVPSTRLWLLVAGVTAVAFFVLGYFSPTPENEDEDEDDVQVGPDDDDEETAVIAGTDADETVVDDTH
jgi:multisubunit Na+/H+ antiporter MnhG subunit